MPAATQREHRQENHDIPALKPHWFTPSRSVLCR
jgi:hypothetical protein